MMLGNKMRMTYCIFGAAEMTSNRPKYKVAEITLYPMCHMNLMVNILKFKKETQQMQTNRPTDQTIQKVFHEFSEKFIGTSNGFHTKNGRYSFRHKL